MILEGLVTTVSASGKVNLTPMGPRFVTGEEQFELRPFESSTTYRNLTQNACGVLHVTDDVELFAQTAIDQLKQLPVMDAAAKVNGFVLKDCCRWFEFEASEEDVEGPRKSFRCQVVLSGRGNREFFGFNRARHAILEATILATRIDILPHDEILDQFQQFQVIVHKTGGPEDRQAFDMLCNFVKQRV